MDTISENTSGGRPVAMVKWEPSIYVPGVGVIYLTIEQVREIIKKNANG